MIPLPHPEVLESTRSAKPLAEINEQSGGGQTHRDVDTCYSGILAGIGEGRADLPQTVVLVE